MKVELTVAQHFILAYANEHTDGKIVKFPDNIKGGARKKVLEGLFNRAMITTDGTDWFIAAEGYDALGLPRPEPTTLVNPEIEATVTSIKPRSRDNSKQAQVIAMLKRPEGATIQQIVEVTGWQQHTVRGTFAGAFKKKLGLNITSSKETDAERIYRVS